MAEYNFVILNVRASLKEQSVFVDFSLDIDEDTISTERIYLLNQDTKSIAPIKTIVNGRSLQLKLLDWAVPNDRYTLIVESGVGSISEDTIDTSLLQDVIFESEIVSEISIVNPYNYQIYRDTINLCWQEETSGKRANSYYIEISDDTGFHHICRTTFIDMSSEISDDVSNDYRYKVQLAPLDNYGQHYIRMRAQDNQDNYGKWSSVVTFDYLEPLQKNNDSADTTPEISPDTDISDPVDNEENVSSPEESELDNTNTSEQPSSPDSNLNENNSPDVSLPEESTDNTNTDADELDKAESDNNSEGETIIIEDLTGIGKKPIILEDNDITIQYEDMLDILPDEFFSVFYPVDIDISQADFSIIRRDI